MGILLALYKCEVCGSPIIWGQSANWCSDKCMDIEHDRLRQYFEKEIAKAGGE